MALISTPLEDGRTKVVVDFPYYTVASKRKYYQHGTKDEQEMRATRHAVQVSGNFHNDSVEVQHDEPNQRWLVISINARRD
jgi:hypothetical protein